MQRCRLYQPTYPPTHTPRPASCSSCGDVGWAICGRGFSKCLAGETLGVGVGPASLLDRRLSVAPHEVSPRIIRQEDVLESCPCARHCVFPELGVGLYVAFGTSSVRAPRGARVRN